MERVTMRRPHGYAVWFGEGRPVEADTITCYHCNRGVIVGSQDSGFCRMCMQHVCGSCADNGVCVPFERKLELYERRRQFREIVERA